MKDAAFSLAEAKFASGGDFNQSVLQNVTKARIKIRSKMDNVAGEEAYRSNCVVTSLGETIVVYYVMYWQMLYIG